MNVEAHRARACPVPSCLRVQLVRHLLGAHEGVPETRRLRTSPRNRCRAPPWRANGGLRTLRVAPCGTAKRLLPPGRWKPDVGGSACRRLLSAQGGRSADLRRFPTADVALAGRAGSYGTQNGSSAHCRRSVPVRLHHAALPAATSRFKVGTGQFVQIYWLFSDHRVDSRGSAHGPIRPVRR
jgi:hypothetical protein